VMVVMMVAVMMPTVHRGGAGNHAVVERFHTRTDAAGDRPFLTTGRTHESEQRLQERHTRNLLAPVATGKGSETLPGSGVPASFAIEIRCRREPAGADPDPGTAPFTRCRSCSGWNAPPAFFHAGRLPVTAIRLLHCRERSEGGKRSAAGVSFLGIACRRWQTSKKARALRFAASLRSL